MMDIDKLVKAGEKLGLTGDDLVKYVDRKEEELRSREERANQRAIEREEAQREREREREERESARVREERESAREREEREREREREERERERREAHEHEARMMQMQIELERTKIADIPNYPNIGGVTAQKQRGPKLPYFEDGKDSMDAYLSRFERYAVNNKWGLENYAMHLGNLLKGRALDVYHRMSIDDVSDYEKLKGALLKEYQLTADGYRKKFHSTRIEKSETATQFISRIAEYFDRWTSLSKIDKGSYDSLREFVVKEQFLFAIPKEISIFLREKPVGSIDELCMAADTYMEAHKYETKFTKSKLNKNGDSDKFHKNSNDHDASNNGAETSGNSKVESSKKNSRAC